MTTISSVGPVGLALGDVRVTVGHRFGASLQSEVSLTLPAATADWAGVCRRLV